MSEQEKKPADFSVDYKTVRLSDLQIEVSVPEAKAQHSALHGGKNVTGVFIDGELIKPSGRFWNSLFARFGINRSFFSYFDHLEVFKRIGEKETDDRLRVTIERHKSTGNARLLAVSGLNRPVVVYDDLLDLLDQYKTTEGGIKYADGIVTSAHKPRIGGEAINIAGDQFCNEMQLWTPIDGYGKPDLYLSLLRLICSNGAVALANRFKTALALGKGGDDISFALRRTLENFNNEEGYAILRDRFDLAARSWSSLREQQELYKLLLGIQNDPKIEREEFRKIMEDYRHLSGDVEQRYMGVNTFNSEKKMRTLPTAARVYELLNFATEIATHRVSERQSRVLQGWVGNMLSGDYDLEESCDQFEDWRQFFATETLKKRQENE